MHVPRQLGLHGRQALNVWWMVPPAWWRQQSTDSSECQRQMSGVGILIFAEIFFSHREFEFL